MEKYEKPVMILEEIEDEVYTIDAGVVMVSGDYNGRPNNNQSLVPGNTTNP